MCMRLCALLLAVIFVPVSSSAQSGGAPPAKDEPTASDTATDHNLPVSIERIRGQLLQPPAAPLRGVNEEIAHFRVEIEERQKLQELIATLDFGKPGPVPAGGTLAGDIQRITRNPTDHPLEQPYAAFSTSELLTVAIENLAGKYLGGRALTAVSDADRERAERAARADVRNSMQDFCEAQPDQGIGLRACDLTLPVR